MAEIRTDEYVWMLCIGILLYTINEWNNTTQIADKARIPFMQPIMPAEFCFPTENNFFPFV